MTAAEQAEHVLENELELYLKDQLSKASLAAVDVHLGSCQACSSKLAELRQMPLGLAELTVGEAADDGQRRRHPRAGDR
jgi:anti-sigma factor RsiW